MTLILSFVDAFRIIITLHAFRSFIAGDLLIAAPGLVLIVITDWIDGKIARSIPIPYFRYVDTVLDRMTVYLFMTAILFMYPSNIVINVILFMCLSRDLWIVFHWLRHRFELIESNVWDRAAALSMAVFGIVLIYFGPDASFILIVVGFCILFLKTGSGITKYKRFRLSLT